MKLINEKTMFKILVERTGLLFSITTSSRAFFFFACTKHFGIKIAPTTDPYPGIVELCNYDLSEIVANWNNFANIKLKRKLS